MSSRLNRLMWLASTALSLSFTVSAHAQDAAPLQGNAAEGQKKFYTCYGCHGLDTYRNAYPDYQVPKLRHQNQAYIVSALMEYKNGDRPHATMHAQAASLSDQDMADIALYLQGDTIVKPSPSQGKAPAQVAPCAACHGENGSGVAADLNPKPPILAGQHESYLLQALTSYHNGRRKNVVMDGMAQLLKTDDDIKTAAEWFSSQSSALVTAKTDSK
jgi:cytochrome c553